MELVGRRGKEGIKNNETETKKSNYIHSLHNLNCWIICIIRVSYLK